MSAQFEMINSSRPTPGSGFYAPKSAEWPFRIGHWWSKGFRRRQVSGTKSTAQWSKRFKPYLFIFQNLTGGWISISERAKTWMASHTAIVPP